jgi:hypothetical protein
MAYHESSAASPAKRHWLQATKLSHWTRQVEALGSNGPLIHAGVKCMM